MSRGQIPHPTNTEKGTANAQSVQHIVTHSLFRKKRIERTAGQLVARLQSQPSLSGCSPSLMGKARCNSGRAFRKEKTTVLRLSWDMCGAKVKKISAQARKDIAENKWSDTIGAIEAPPTIRNAVATLSLDASNGRRNVRTQPSSKTRRMGTRLRSISQEERSMAQRSKLFSVLKEKQIQSHVALFDWSRTVEGCHQCRV